MKTFYKINNGLAKLWLFCSISIFEETSYFFWLICGLPVGVSCMFVYLKVEKQNKTQVQACISPHSSLKKCSNCNHNSSKQDNTDSHSAKHGNKISTLPKLFSYQVMEFFTQSVVMVFLPSITHSRHVMANTHTHQQVVIPPGELCINHISQHIPSVYLSKAVEFASFSKLQLERFSPQVLSDILSIIKPANLSSTGVNIRIFIEPWPLIIFFDVILLVNTLQ